MKYSKAQRKTKTDKKCYDMLIFVVPALVFVLIFSYIPMSGLIMAFKQDIDLTEYSSPVLSIIFAKNAGLGQFKLLFSSPAFLSAFSNTLIISVLKIVIVFPIPIFLAIIITEIKNRFASKFIQAIAYLPHFLSWAIVSSMFISFLRIDEGAFNIVLKALNIPQLNVSSPSQFRGILVLTTAWKDIGWSTVTYIAAIMAIDLAQYEAARIDGASKLQQSVFITLPSIASTIAVLLILRIGYIMDAGFEQVYAMLTPTAEPTGEIIGTLIYKISIKNGGRYEFTTAAGLFNSVISLVLIVGGNFISKKVFDRGII